jgi:quercetin dioxygenase-like cupin family protein
LAWRFFVCLRAPFVVKLGRYWSAGHVDFAKAAEYVAAYRVKLLICSIPRKFKESDMRVQSALCGVAACLCLGAIAWGQDPVKTDPKHYSVISENDQVRILKVHYGRHEKSIMHSHPNAVAVSLTNASGQFTFPDGKTQPFSFKAGDAQFTPAGTHLPENTSDTAMDIIVIELKGHAKPKPAMSSGTK